MKVEIIIRPEMPPPEPEEVMQAAEIANEIEERFPAASVSLKVMW